MSSNVIFKRMAILGVGLMGGSLALAAKRAGSVDHVVGWSRRDSTLKKGLAAGVIDSAELDLCQALQGADCVVIATPTQLAESVLLDVVDRVASDVVVTDVASVKGNLKNALEQRYGDVPPNVVLGHPIAGSEKSGVDAANPDLYCHHNVILIDEAGSSGAGHTVDVAMLAQVRALWESVGAKVFTLSASEHDAVLAHTSHLPHLLAFALVDQLATSADAENMFRFAAGGFRDFTRIAGSDPVMWQEIFAANREQLLLSLQGFERATEALRGVIEAGDAAQLQAQLEKTRQVRDAFSRQLAARRAGQEKGWEA